MELRAVEDIRNTKCADDVDMLINCILQLVGGCRNASVDIPNNRIHCKYWENVSASELCDILEHKYRNDERLNIPLEFTTSY